MESCRRLRKNGHGIPCWILAVRPPLIKKSQMFSVKLMKIEKNTRSGVFGLGGIGDGGAQNKRLARLKQQLGVLQAEKIAQDVLNYINKRLQQATTGRN